MKKLILASNSARRRQLLKDHGFKFIVKPAHLDEIKYTHLPPLEMVKTLSLKKADKIANENPNAVVIGADTTVVLEKKNIGKPKDLNEAFKILSKLSGSTHTVYTGFTIIKPNKKPYTSYAATKLNFKKITDKQIKDYIKTHDVLDFAGSYAIQEEGDEFVKDFDGDYFNILGLPTKAIEKLKEIIK